MHNALESRAQSKTASTDDWSRASVGPTLAHVKPNLWSSDRRCGSLIVDPSYARTSEDGQTKLITHVDQGALSFENIHASREPRMARDLHLFKENK
jgi:hypothetical protein